jgi:large subunit ribosomal protein L10
MRPEKKAILDEVQGALEKSTFVVLTEFRGLKVDQMTLLRTQLRRAGARMLVVKNRYLSLVAGRTGRGDLASLTGGPTAMITGEADITRVAKLLKAFTVENNSLPVVRGGMLGTRLLSAEDLAAMADIPPREVLLARFVGAVAAPLSQLVGVMNQKMLSLLYVMKAIEKKKSGA